jgi:hypothetical protein
LTFSKRILGVFVEISVTDGDGDVDEAGRAPGALSSGTQSHVCDDGPQSPKVTWIIDGDFDRTSVTCNSDSGMWSEMC